MSINKKKGAGILLSFLLLVVITAIAQTISPRGSSNNQISDPGNDVVEGTPTNDDPWNEMKKLVDANSNEQGVSIRGKVKIIDDNSENEKVIEEQDFEYSFVGKSMYQKVGDMEFVNKPGLALIADNSNKFIAVSASAATEDKRKNLFDLKEFRKILEERKAEIKITQVDDQKALTVDKINDPQVQGYRVYYDPTTYRIKKILIGMLRLSPLEENDEQDLEKATGNTGDDKSKNESAPGTIDEEEIETYTYYLEITYSEIKTLGLSERSFAPENKFIIKTKDKIELAPAFSGYQFLNNGSSENEN